MRVRRGCLLELDNRRGRRAHRDPGDRRLRFRSVVHGLSSPPRKSRRSLEVKMHQLTGQDAMFLYLDQPHASTHGLLVYIYDQSTAPNGMVRFKDILKHIEANLHLAPFFRKKLLRVPLELDFPYLVDDENFDINYHVRHIALPKPGDWRQFCIQAARIAARPLDLSRPLWEMYVVEGLDNIDFLPKGCFAILTKLHHSVVDGTALSELTWRLHSRTPSIVRARPKQWTPEKPPETFALLKRAALNTAFDAVR